MNGLYLWANVKLVSFILGDNIRALVNNNNFLSCGGFGHLNTQGDWIMSLNKIYTNVRYENKKTLNMSMARKKFWTRGLHCHLELDDVVPKFVASFICFRETISFHHQKTIHIEDNLLSWGGFGHLNTYLGDWVMS